MDTLLGLIVIFIICYVIKHNASKNKKISNVKPSPTRKCYVVIDTETSSLNPDSGEVLQLSAIKVDFATGQIFQLFDTYIKPSVNCEFNTFSMQINQISKAKLAKAPDKLTVFREFFKFIGECEIVGYNIRFDIRMLQDDMRKVGIDWQVFHFIDVLELARTNLDIDSYKLINTSDYCGYKPIGNYHNSLHDTVATNYVYRYLLNVPQSTIPYKLKEKLVSKPTYNNVTIPQFSDKNICITGDFDNFTRQELTDIIINSGGNVKSCMSRKVHILLKGVNFTPTNKERKYIELTENGYDIEAINEQKLIDIIETHS